MLKNCSYCQSKYDDSLPQCPQCGAPNENIRKADGTPKTIEELKAWYKSKKLPPKDVTRFYIGENYKGPRAIGIYKDENTGNYIVYKNKNDGHRAIRYNGKDESYAVHEIYVKLKEEIANQKSKNVQPVYKSSQQQYKTYPKQKLKLSEIITLVIIAIVLFTLLRGCIYLWNTTPNGGYYGYNNQTYYNRGGKWYVWDDDWFETDVPDDLYDNYSDYYNGSSYDSNSDYSDWRDSEWNTSNNSSYYDDDDDDYSYWDDDDDWDWDSDSDWDSDWSWDSGGSDWDSDW